MLMCCCATAAAADDDDGGGAGTAAACAAAAAAAHLVSDDHAVAGQVQHLQREGGREERRRGENRGVNDDDAPQGMGEGCSYTVIEQPEGASKAASALSP